MTQQTTTAETTPPAMHTVTPHLCCAGAAAAIDFYTKAFGATEVMRMPGPDGRLMHAMIRIGDSTLMLHDEMPEWGALGPKARGGSAVTMHLMVADVDAAFARAVAAGASVKMPVADQFWGDRYGKVTDPFGHDWSLATPLRQMTPDEIMAAGKKVMASMAADGSDCAKAP